MKIIKRILPVILAAAILLSTSLSAIAQGEPTEKEEVIYINLNADGSVKDIYAVNIFGKGEVTDYGEYTAVEMLNTTDKIAQNGDLITFSASRDRVYYKGKMKNTVIPWDISIQYFIDGTEYSAKEVAGKSGKLEIRFQVTENESAQGNFFDDYALQAAFTLDTEKCTNITADNATLANVGSSKQISYTMLPGEGIDTAITADVTDFEMAAVSINGIPLSMNIEVDDQELMDQVTELLDAIAELDDGAGELKDGVAQLQDGAEEDLQAGVKELTGGVNRLHDGAGELKDGSAALKEGTGQLQSGAAQLDDGIQSLNNGVNMVQQGLTALNSKSSDLTAGSSEMQKALLTIQQELNAVSASTEQLDQLVTGSSVIKTGIAELSQGIAALQSNVSFAAYKAAMQEQGLDIDQLQAANGQTIRSLENQIDTLNQNIAALESMGGDAQQIAQLKASAEQLEGIVTLLRGNSAAIAGTEVYLTQINSGIGKLAAGVTELKDHYDDLDAGINALAVEIKGLFVHMSALRSGIDTLITEYGKLDSGIQEYTDGVASVVAGYSQLSDGARELLAGSKELKTGTDTLYTRTGDLLNGIVEFYSATGPLKDGTGKLDEGVARLLAGIAGLYDGTGELKDGTAEMRKETDGMDTEISDKIDEMLERITGNGAEVTSFVSEKNTHVDSVQFVIQTEAIEIAESAPEEVEVKEDLTFWQKLLRLFGLY